MSIYICSLLLGLKGPKHSFLITIACIFISLLIQDFAAEMGLEDSKQVTWADMKKEENGESLESSSYINDSESEVSSSSSLSADLADDATSSFSSSSSDSSPSRGALYEFAELIAQLPIKKGLSKYYNGKSRTFASLSSVTSVEDLAKEERLCSKRMKSCKSYGSNLNRHKFGPKPTIAKRSKAAMAALN